MTNPLDKLNLRPLEKNLVISAVIAVFLAFNYWFVWPQFGEWGETRDRLDGARTKYETYTKAIGQKNEYERKVKEFESEGQSVAEADQANRFLLKVQEQASASGVQILANMRPTTSTNDPFFIEQRQTFHVQAREEQLIDFLFMLGSGDSMARARSLSFRPSQNRQALDGTIDLVANYQRKAPEPKPAAPRTASAKALDTKGEPAADKKPAGPVIRTTPKPAGTTNSAKK